MLLSKGGFLNSVNYKKIDMLKKLNFDIDIFKISDRNTRFMAVKVFIFNELKINSVFK